MLHFWLRQTRRRCSRNWLHRGPRLHARSERAKVLLGYSAGTSITELQRRLGFGRPMIYRCIDKALAAGVQAGLKDKYHRPHEPEITDEAKAWVVSIACTKPKDHGLAAELWTISALARFVCERAQAAGFDRLAKAGKSTVWRILDENQIKPHRIRYYLEKRDPQFDRKMQEVLMVYRDVSSTAKGPFMTHAPTPSTPSASTRSPVFRRSD